MLSWCRTEYIFSQQNILTRIISGLPYITANIKYSIKFQFIVWYSIYLFMVFGEHTVKYIDYPTYICKVKPCTNIQKCIPPCVCSFSVAKKMN